VLAQHHVAHLRQVRRLADDLRAPLGDVAIGEPHAEHTRLVERDPTDVVQERGVLHRVDVPRTQPEFGGHTDRQLGGPGGVTRSECPATSGIRASDRIVWA
jgi:hypothetical protein